MDKNPLQIWTELVAVRGLENIAETESLHFEMSGQPGGQLREWLRCLIEVRAGLRPEWPVCRVSHEREGD